jgi:methylmalonyl-CoA/ethylmalonyl-CoA epimerase
MAVHELRIAVTVEDWDAAVRLYRDTLGMAQLELWQAPGARGMLLDAGRATLELFDEGQAAMVDEVEVGRRVAGPVRLALRVDDSVAAAEAVVAAGAAELVAEPVTTPWNDRNVRLRAPDGMQLTLFTPAPL